MKIAIITAGGAGMFCGSCMQDNTLARTLRLAGEDAVLVPTYTAIRVDEENVSTDRIFLGGVNVYLDSAVPGWKRLPAWMTGWLNRPGLIQWLTKFGGGTDAAKLGALTLDMLKGNHGPQHREVHQFADFLCDELQPDVIVFSNALLSGVLSELRPRFKGTILCLLQGDDVFLEELTPRWKQPVLQQLRQNCRDFDGFLTHSRYYRDFMMDYLQIAEDRFSQIPLTIDSDEVLAGVGSSAPPRSDTCDRFRLGYFARLCPEKGIQNLLNAAVEALPMIPNSEVAIAGYLSEQHRQWFEGLLQNASSRLPGRVHWLGSPAERSEKFRIIRDFDLLCVPTDYREPKGLYVLEAGLAAIPSLLPRHGAFPELVEALGHGLLYEAGSHDALVKGIIQASSLKQAGTSSLPQRVQALHGMATTGRQIVEVIERLRTAER